MTTATLPSGTGIVSTYTYDDADRLTNIAHVKGGSTILPRKDPVAYTLDDVGNRTQRVDQQGTHTYAYDDLYRLTSVTYPGPSTTSYAFDAFGNRTSMTVAGNTTTYAYDDNDRITSVTPPSPASVINYTWDDPSRKDDLTARGSDSFSWDYEDRMVSATVNSVTTTFAYRGDGLRNSRTVGGNTTTFTWDPSGEGLAGLPVVLDDGNQYVYGAGLTAQKQAGSWSFSGKDYLADGLGSTMAVVNASGVVQDSYTYDVYGTPTKTGSLANEFDFAVQQTDGTGLQYLRARYMDPATGTFLSRDPMNAQTRWITNPYAYAAGAPSVHTDPSGLCVLHLPCPPVPVPHFDGCGSPIGGPICIRSVDWVELADLFGGAIRLVKLTGEYTIQLGENFGQVIRDNPWLLELLFDTAASAAAYACVYGGLETGGAACTGMAVVAGIYIGWKLAELWSDDDAGLPEKVARSLIQVINAIPVDNWAKTIFDAVSSALQEPTEVH